MRPHGSAHSLEHRRVEALQLYRRGIKPSHIARRLGTTRQSVNRWMRSCRRKGRRALAAKPVPGRPAKLNAAQRRQLANVLIQGAVTAGYATNLWTCPRIVQVLHRQFGVTYHVDYLPRLLNAMGFSCQKPESRAIERDEKAIAQWIRRDWRRIKKTPSDGTPISFSSTKQAF
jgi:transposase